MSRPQRPLVHWRLRVDKYDMGSMMCDSLPSWSSTWYLQGDGSNYCTYTWASCRWELEPRCRRIWRIKSRSGLSHDSPRSTKRCLVCVRRSTLHRGRKDHRRAEHKNQAERIRKYREAQMLNFSFSVSLQSPPKCCFFLFCFGTV